MKDILTAATQCRKGRLSRRRFMQLAAAMGIGASSAASWLQQAHAAPKRGGHFRIGIGFGSTIDSIDPGTYQDTYMQTVGLAFRNCLTELDNEDNLIGELASDWEASPDAKVWRFTLRKGVEFHNGKTMTADDVVASIQHHIGENSTSVAKGSLAPVKVVRKDGANVVVVELTSGNVDFPYLMSDYHLGIMPSKNGEVDWRSGIGTGGYVLDDFNPGVRTTLKRNPNYWKENAAHFDSLEALVMLDVAARTSALRTNGIDAMNQVDLKTVNLLARDANLKIHETQGTLHFGYAMVCTIAPFDNVSVRTALKYAIDREEFLQKILYGHGYVGNDHPIGRSNRFFNAEMEQRTYDPDKAKFYLREAGLSKLKVDLSVADVGFSAVDGAVLYSEAARKAGISIKVDRVSKDGYWENVWGVKPWSAEYWAGRVTEDWMFSLAYAKDAPWSRTKWHNERFNALLKQARTEFDDDKRRAMYYEMQQLCSDGDGAVVPIFGNYVFATTKKVGNNRLSAAWDLDGIKCMERWWFV